MTFRLRRHMGARCSTGTTATRAPCHGARRRAARRSLSPSGSPKSCCSRRPSRRSMPYFAALSGALAGCRRRSPPRRVEEVMRAWAGLGYYARARNLHACARAVVARHGGRFPDEEAALRALPGIGPYTAAAVAAIAFGARRSSSTAMSSAWWRGCSPSRRRCPRPSRDPRAGRGADPARRPGDYAQAMMDLGATICTPKNPACAICPLTAVCAGRGGAFALSCQGAEAGPAAAAGRRVLHLTRGRRGACANAAAKRPARRHDGNSRHALERGFRRGRRASPRAAQGPLPQA